MLDMICAVPSPCGAEELIKKYISKKAPCECYEDGIGNLILHFGSGKRKIMVYAPIDEDSLVVMSKDKNKIHFAQLGGTKLYPGMSVSFGGYKGVICSDEKDPAEGQYIKMLTESSVSVGASGVLDFEFSDEDDVVFAKHAAEKTAAAAMLECASSGSSVFDVYFVFGVQGANGHKGAIAASGSIKPDVSVIFEGAKRKDDDKLTLKLLTSGYVCSEKIKQGISQICEDIDVGLSYSVDSDEKSCGDVLRCDSAAVIGIPAEFYNAPRQAVKKSIKDDIKKILDTLLAKENDL